MQCSHSAPIRRPQAAASRAVTISRSPSAAGKASGAKTASAPSRSRKIGAPLSAMVSSSSTRIGSRVAGPPDRTNRRHPAGPAARHGHRSLLVGTAAAGCLLGFGLAPAYPALVLPAVFGGLAAATLPTVSLAVARVRFAGAGRRRAIGWVTAGGAGAAVLSVPLGTALAGVAGWRAAFVAAGPVALGGGWLVRSALPAPTPARAGAPPARTLIDAYAPLLWHGPTRRLYGATVLRSVCWSRHATFVGALLRERRRLGLGPVALVFMVGVAAFVNGRT